VRPPIAGTPTDAPPHRPIEVRLTLTAPSEPDAEPPTETTAVPVPSTIENPDVIVDPLPVTVAIDSGTAPSPPADVITDLPVDMAPLPTDTTPVPGLGGIQATDPGTDVPVVVTDPVPSSTDPVVTVDPAPTPDTGGVAAPDPTAIAAQ
jgi:hypothetical protein